MNKVILKMLGATLLWASVFHVGKYALQELPPLVVMSWRNGAAGILLILLTWPALRQHWQQIRAHATILLILALTGVAGFSAFMFYGLATTTPVNAALITAFNPALIVLLSAWANRERIGLMQAAGLVLGLCGVLVVVTHGSMQALLNLHIARGDVLVAGAALCWAIYCVLPKRYVRGLPSAVLSSTTVALAGAMLTLTAFAAAPEMHHFPRPGMIAVLLFLGLMGTVIPYLWWNSGVLVLGPARAGIYMNLVPVFASLIGLLTGSSLQGSQLTGALMVIAGVCLTSQGAAWWGAIKQHLRAGGTPPPPVRTCTADRSS